MNFELTKEFLQELSLAVAKRNGNYVSEKIQDLHPADIAEIFDRIDLFEAQFIYELLDEEVASDVLVELEEDVRDKFLKSFTAQEIASQVDNMDSDDATDLIQDLSEERKEKVLSKLEDAEQASDIVSLLSYPEDTAGGLMAKEYIKANINWTVEECLEELRSQAEDVDYVHTIYVVDNQNKLQGTLSLKTFLFAGNNTKISDLYKEEPIYVKTDTPDEDVANIMEKYDLVALPVLNQANILVGRITIDDIVEVIKEEAEKDFQLASGISENVESKDSVWLLTRARLPWLLVGLLGGILGAVVISSFESELKQFPVLAFFIPLIAAMAGNVGVQSSAIIVQGLANNSLSYGSTFSKVVKEVGVALINGAVLSSLIFIYNIAFGEAWELCFTVSLSLFVVIIFAGIFGTLIPLVLDQYNIDPALATGPFITTVNDVVGLLLYFTIGWMIYF